MEEKELTQIIEENEKRFKEEKDIKKSIDEVTKKHEQINGELVRFFGILKLEKFLMKLFRRHQSSQISEFENTTDVFINHVEERLFLLEKIGIYLSAMERNQEQPNMERTIKMLTLFNTLLFYVGEEASFNHELYTKQANAMKERRPYILEKEDIYKKTSLDNNITEIRRILNND